MARWAFYTGFCDSSNLNYDYYINYYICIIFNYITILFNVLNCQLKVFETFLYCTNVSKSENVERIKV